MESRSESSYLPGNKPFSLPEATAPGLEMESAPLPAHLGLTRGAWGVAHRSWRRALLPLLGGAVLARAPRGGTQGRGTQGPGRTQGWQGGRCSDVGQAGDHGPVPQHL